MADTIRILAKKAYRFQKPGSDPMTLAKPETSGPAVNDVYFTATVGEVCEAPSWIKEDPLFDIVAKEENLHVVTQGDKSTEPQKAGEHKPGEAKPGEHASAKK